MSVYSKRDIPEHLHKYFRAAEMGLEASPELYVRKVVLFFREIRRVLKNDGTVWLNIGDSYWGSNKGAGQKDFSNSAIQTRNSGSLKSTPTTSRRHAFLKPKDLIGVPWRVALALQEDGWWLRQDNIWHKKNPMTESVLDRTTRSHEYLFHLTKSSDYYYNYIAVQEDCVSNERDIARMKNPPKKDSKYKDLDDHRLAGGGSKIKHQAVVGNGIKRNRRSVWTLATSNFRGSHEATMPEALAEPCILAGCPKGGVVLDPFCGSGTTGLVAQRLGRKFIGFELNPEYAKVANSRLKSDAED